MLRASPRKLAKVMENIRFSRQPLVIVKRKPIEVKVAR
jgi:hypothetical protein